MTNTVIHIKRRNSLKCYTTKHCSAIYPNKVLHPKEIYVIETF